MSQLAYSRAALASKLGPPTTYYINHFIIYVTGEGTKWYNGTSGTITVYWSATLQRRQHFDQLVEGSQGKCETHKQAGRQNPESKLDIEKFLTMGKHIVNKCKFLKHSCEHCSCAHSFYDVWL